MKNLFLIGSIVLVGMVLYGVNQSWIQPYWNAAQLQSSIPDCLFATQVGSASAGKVKFSPNGKFLAVNSNSRHAILDANSGDTVAEFAKAKDKVTGLRFSPNDNQFAFGDESGIQLKSPQGEDVAAIDLSQDGKLGVLGELAFYPSQNAIAITRKDGVCLYETSGKKLRHLPTANPVRSLAVHGEAVFAADYKGAITQWRNLDDPQPMVVQAHQEYLAKAVLGLDGKYWATLGRDHKDSQGELELKLWAAKDLTLIETLTIGTSVTSFSMDAQSNYLLVAKSTGQAIAFNMSDFTIAKSWSLPRGILSSDIAPDGSAVCFGLGKKSISIDTDTHHDFTTGRFRTRRGNKAIPYQTIKGDVVSPGAVVVLSSGLAASKTP